jgi:hypothetical protein
MDRLSIFGFVAVSLMLAFYALEDRAEYFGLAFAGACLMAAVYGFLQGAWPFALVETIWSGVAVRRWMSRRAAARRLVKEPEELAVHGR